MSTDRTVPDTDMLVRTSAPRVNATLHRVEDSIVIVSMWIESHNVDLGEPSVRPSNTFAERVPALFDDVTDMRALTAGRGQVLIRHLYGQYLPLSFLADRISTL